MELIDFIMHIEEHLRDFIAVHGKWIYVVLFLIIFCETGLVVTPFLPGDSLLFAVGMLASEGLLSLEVIISSLIIAAVIGDAVNYWIGRWIGEKAYEMNSRYIKREYLLRTREFYERHGGKAIILARFIPIIRTFAPFVAGIAQMSYKRFTLFNITGAFIWIISLTLAGYFLANVPGIKSNLKLIILIIIFVSLLPVFYEAWKVRRQLRTYKSYSQGAKID